MQQPQNLIEEGLVQDLREDIGDKENFLILRELATSEC